jgi:hypothetical protein
VLARAAPGSDAGELGRPTKAAPSLVSVAASKQCVLQALWNFDRDGIWRQTLFSIRLRRRQALAPGDCSLIDASTANLEQERCCMGAKEESRTNRAAFSLNHLRHDAIDDEARLIIEGEAAELLTLSIKTLRNWPSTPQSWSVGPLPPKRHQSLAQNLRARLDKRPERRPCLSAAQSISSFKF